MPVTAAVFENNLFAHYPLTIFPRPINVLATWIVPYGFAAFYPDSVLLGRDMGPPAWLAPFMAVILLSVGYAVWNVGLRHYQGTGS